MSLKNMVSLTVVLLLFFSCPPETLRAKHEIPLLPLAELPEGLVQWENSLVTLRGFLHRGSWPVMTANPFDLLAMTCPFETLAIPITAIGDRLLWNPWEQAQVVFADLTGWLRLEADGRIASLELEEDPKLYYPVLYPYPRPPEETLPKRQFNRHSADYLVVVGSQGHPVPEWMEHTLITKWEMGLFFNASPSHLKIFYGEGRMPLGTMDPWSIRQRKAQMKPYMMKGSAEELFSFLASLEARMLDHLENEEKPTLTLMISGYSQLIEETLHFYLGPEETLEIESLAQALDRIALLGEVRIVLDTSFAGAWAEGLLQSENTSLVISCEKEEESYFHQHGTSLQLSRYLLSGKAGKSLGRINWSELLEKLNPPFSGEGAQWEEKLTYTLLSPEEGRYSIWHQQIWIDHQAHASSLSEYLYEMVLPKSNEEPGAEDPQSKRTWKNTPAFHSSGLAG